MLVFEAVLITNEKSTLQWNEMSQFILISYLSVVDKYGNDNARSFHFHNQ